MFKHSNFSKVTGGLTTFKPRLARGNLLSDCRAEQRVQSLIKGLSELHNSPSAALKEDRPLLCEHVYCGNVCILLWDLILQPRVSVTALWALCDGGIMVCKSCVRFNVCLRDENTSDVTFNA